MKHATFTTDQRKKLAEEGEAMPDGSFPIRNRADLVNAISAIGRAKDYASTKRFIIKRARELDAMDLLPDIWTANLQQTAIAGKEFIEHYGVKGMRWGVRKRRNESDRKQTFGGRKQQKSDPLKNMSDQELRAIVNRMNMEQQYTRLSSSGGRSGNRAVNIGAAFLGGIAVNIARQQIQNQANAKIAAALAARAAKKVSS